MCGYNVTVRKLNLEYGIWQCFNDRTLEFYNVVLRQNNPSFKDCLLIDLCKNYHTVIGNRYAVLIMS